jgi:hypothetical protein
LADSWLIVGRRGGRTREMAKKREELKRLERIDENGTKDYLGRDIAFRCLVT